jgi:hypothetical protein
MEGRKISIMKGKEGREVLELNSWLNYRSWIALDRVGRSHYHGRPHLQPCPNKEEGRGVVGSPLPSEKRRLSSITITV